MMKNTVLISLSFSLLTLSLLLIVPIVLIANLLKVPAVAMRQWGNMVNTCKASLLLFRVSLYLLEQMVVVLLRPAGLGERQKRNAINIDNAFL